MSLLKQLPGVELPVAEVARTLSEMWAVDRENGGEFRASQMNLILHFGVQTTRDEAEARFHTAIRFGQRYPCRIIVLCPSEEQEGPDLLQAKLFTQCYIGSSLREMCCCEALMLSYATSEFVHLRNQVTVWLEADLPTCHWFHRVPADRITRQYLEFIHSFRRVLFDSAVEGDAYSGLDWPHPKRVVDIAGARLLPVKQALGPFLSGFPPEFLVEGLEQVTIAFNETYTAEGLHLEDWVRQGVRACLGGDEVKLGNIRFDQEALTTNSLCLRMVWRANGEECFRWEMRADGHGSIASRFGVQNVERIQLIEWISPEVALSESIFF